MFNEFFVAALLLVAKKEAAEEGGLAARAVFIIQRSDRTKAGAIDGNSLRRARGDDLECSMQ